MGRSGDKEVVVTGHDEEVPVLIREYGVTVNGTPTPHGGIGCRHPLDRGQATDHGGWLRT